MFIIYYVITTNLGLKRWLLKLTNDATRVCLAPTPTDVYGGGRRRTDRQTDRQTDRRTDGLPLEFLVTSLLDISPLLSSHPSSYKTKELMSWLTFTHTFGEKRNRFLTLKFGRNVARLIVFLLCRSCESEPNSYYGSRVGPAATEKNVSLGWFVVCK